MGAPLIHVLAGAPGAGKTSLGGAMLRFLGLDYFDPEAFARAVLEDRGCPLEQALHAGWSESVRRLEAAIERDGAYAFETTLAGRTIPTLLALAARRGVRVRLWYFGLSDPDRLVARGARRALHGGFPHDEAAVRRAWSRSVEHLVCLLPYLDGVRVFDNSAERAPCDQVRPEPRELLRLVRGQPPASAVPLSSVPGWAKPVFEAVLQAG